MLHQHIEDGVVFNNLLGMCLFLQITNASARAGRLVTSVKIYSVDITLHSLLASAASGISKPSPRHTKHISVKIPASVVDHRLLMLPKKILKHVEQRALSATIPCKSCSFSHQTVIDLINPDPPRNPSNSIITPTTDFA